MALLTQDGHCYSRNAPVLHARTQPPPGRGQPLPGPPPPDPVCSHPRPPQSPLPAPLPDSCPATTRQLRLAQPRRPNQPPGVGGAPGPRDGGLGIWKGLSDPLFLSASWTHLPGSLALLFQNCLLFSAAIAQAQGRPSRRARGVPGEMPPGSRNRRANPGRFPAAGQRLPACGSAILGVGNPPDPAPLPLVGCPAAVGRTNQGPESCRPLKPDGDVRGRAHRWTGRRCWAGREAGLKVLTPGAGEEAGKGPREGGWVLCSLEGWLRSLHLICLGKESTCIIYISLDPKRNHTPGY